MKEITFELTNFCEERCKYCSSDTVIYIDSAKFLDMGVMTNFLYGKTFDRIHLSGGEPLAHPQFYQIVRLCQKYTKDVVIHTNLLTHIIFNANVIDNIYVEMNVSTSPDVNKVNILKRIEQGKERTRPEVHFSGNWTHECTECDQPIILPNGTMVQSPCKKEQKME
jgi:molybdenum cofactor biosynthesis enzyme MoaA